MSNATNPSARWTSAHGFRSRDVAHNPGRAARRGKITYGSWWLARWACFRTSRHDKDLRPYACRWGDDYRDGETAPRHWHIGHTSARDWWGY